MRIPKIVHFVWAGGKKKLPREYAKNIRTWAEQNRDFEIRLWIDKKTDPEAMEYYQQEIAAGRLPPNLILSDIEEEHVSTPHARYEFERLKPNYGKSSDQLRYRILHRFGGAYFDSDVVPDATSLGEHEAFTQDWEGHQCLYVDPNSQNTGVIGNDAFISTRQNPVMLRLSEFCERSYRGLDSVKELVTDSERETFERTCERVGPEGNVNAYDEDEHIFLSTIESTGPGAVRSVIGSTIPPEGAHRLGSMIKPMVGVTQIMDQKPTGKWRSMPITPCSAETAVGKAIQAISFEVQNMGILRIDDHVNNVIEATKNEEFQLSKERITELLIEAVLGIDERLHGEFIPKIEKVQLTFQNRTSQRLLMEHGFFDKIKLFPFSDELDEQTFLQILSPFSDPALANQDCRLLDPDSQEKVQQGVRLIELMLENHLETKLTQNASPADTKYFCIRQLSRILETYKTMNHLPREVEEKFGPLEQQVTKLEMRMKALRDHERATQAPTATPQPEPEPEPDPAPKPWWRCCF